MQMDIKTQLYNLIKSDQTHIVTITVTLFAVLNLKAASLFRTKNVRCF